MKTLNLLVCIAAWLVVIVTTSFIQEYFWAGGWVTVVAILGSTVLYTTLVWVVFKTLIRGHGLVFIQAYPGDTLLSNGAVQRVVKTEAVVFNPFLLGLRLKRNEGFASKELPPWYNL